MSRRQMLATSFDGFRLDVALRSLMADSSYAGLAAVSPPHVTSRPSAKTSCSLFMPGGVSHVDSFDPKPALTNTTASNSVIGQSLQAESHLQPQSESGSSAPGSSKNHGDSGAPVSELFPNMAPPASTTSAVIRSMVAELPLHAAGNLFLHSGTTPSRLTQPGLVDHLWAGQ